MDIHIRSICAWFALARDVHLQLQRHFSIKLKFRYSTSTTYGANLAVYAHTPISVTYTESSALIADRLQSEHLKVTIPASPFQSLKPQCI
jgi:hypothetical protein